MPNERSCTGGTVSRRTIRFFLYSFIPFAVRPMRRGSRFGAQRKGGMCFCGSRLEAARTSLYAETVSTEILLQLIY